MKVRTTGLAVYIILVLLALTVSVPLWNFSQTAAAASTITLTPSVQSNFPYSITFKILAAGNAVIDQLRLHYIVEKQNYAEVISEGWPVFSPATSVDTQWVWDMRKSPLPVGTTIEYWWTARDNAGHAVESDRHSFQFNDTQHNWKSMVEGPVTLYWYSGDTDFANSLMDAAQQGLETIENDIGIFTEGNVSIYIYGSQIDLLMSQLFAPDWQGGVTFQGYDVIAIAVATNQLFFGLSATPHELTHWVIGRFIFNPYGAGLPVWLNEGLATYVQDEKYENWLADAIAQNKLISVRTLSSPFSAVSEQAYISYAESQSIVTFLLSEYGKEKMADLLEAFRNGATDDAALLQVYGFDQDGLDQVWRQSVGVAVSP